MIFILLNHYANLILKYTLLKNVFQGYMYITYIYMKHIYFLYIITETKMLHTFLCVDNLVTQAIDHIE